MYSYLTGIIKEIESSYIVIDNHGIGYLIYTANTYQFHEEEEVKIYVYQQLRNHGNNYSSYMYELGNGTGNAGHPAILTVKINPQYNYYVRVYADTISNTSIPMTLGYQIEYGELQ